MNRTILITIIHISALIMSFVLIYFCVLPETGTWTSLFIGGVVMNLRLTALNDAIDKENKKQLARLRDELYMEIRDSYNQTIHKPRNEDC